VPVTLVVMTLATPVARGDAFTDGNLLISPDDVLYDYTPSGTFVQGFSIQYPGSETTEYAGDVAINSDGAAHVCNGTFDPYLSTLEPVAESWGHRTYTEWSTVNDGTDGGIGIYGDYVFVTDMDTYGDEAEGVIRFDMTDGTVVVGNRIGEVEVTDEDFTSPSTFSVGSDGSFVHVVPEPRTAILLAMLVGVLAARHGRPSADA
jgi:hypothetical protein